MIYLLRKSKPKKEGKETVVTVEGESVDKKSTFFHRFHNKSSSWVKKVSDKVSKDPFDNESMILHRKG